MSTCSLFKNLHKPIEKKTMLAIANDIASDKYKAPVQKIRYLLQQGKTAEAQELKKQLASFTPSAIFRSRRVKEDIESYSGIIHLDFDKLTDEQMGKLRIALSSTGYTHIYFVSPSGKGIKVFVEVTSAVEEHHLAYKQVQDYYENLTGIKADPSCKDITRLCFVSYDPDIYRNLESRKFPVRGRKSLGCVEGLDRGHPVPNAFGIVSGSLTEPLTPSEEIFNNQIQFTNRIKTYREGSRNAYIYQLALNCNKAGLAQQTTVDLITRHFDLPFKEMEQTVKSAYKRTLEAERSEVPPLRDLEGLEGLGSLESLDDLEEQTKPSQPSQPSQPTQPSQSRSRTNGTGKSGLRFAQLSLDDEENTRELMPTLPDGIFETMPGFLQKATGVASTKEERDLLLLGSVTTLGAALHQLTGTYNDTPVNANLFLFVSAMASAGKGILIHCRKLVLPIHLQLREEARRLKECYDAEMADYRNNKNKDASLEQPRKPPVKMFFIPGNNSATGFLEILSDSNKRGIIFETEGDTLSNALQSDYGDFSDALRNAFQHEPISYYRRTDKEYVEIDRPSLSVVLSGTPKQVKVLIPNTENGLFSRFMFYMMNMNWEWKNVFASRTANGLDKHFENLGRQFYIFYQHLETLPAMTFTLTNDQEERFNAFFHRIQKLYITIQEEDIVSCVRRLGLMAYRVMMIFSALRLMESKKQVPKVVCEEVDFDNSLAMIEVLVKHSSYVFTQVADEVQRVKPKNRKEKFLELLPAEFNRQGYLQVAQQLKIADKTAQGYIRKFVLAGIVLNDYHDHYLNLQVKLPQKERPADSKDSKESKEVTAG
ncbi:MAG: DUF3987 domain-containing protein [Candidatus Dadabacteria bacterium]